MLAPCVPQMLASLEPTGGNKALGAFAISSYILGFTIGILAIAPLAKVYGRAPVLRGSSFGFLIFTLLCATSRSMGMLIAARILAGCFGGVPMALGGAVIADVFGPGSRHKATALYTQSVMIGPLVGPVLGGAINEGLGWRWVFWITSILVRDEGTLIPS